MKSDPVPAPPPLRIIPARPGEPSEPSRDEPRPAASITVSPPTPPPGRAVRALAVVGLWLAGQATWRTAFHAARALAQKIGDRVLDVQAGDCRRPFVQSRRRR